jgi:hypothetical protein
LRTTRSGIRVGHFLGDQPKDNRLRLIVLLVVAKADRLECVDGFARCVHWLNVVFVSTRRDICSTKSTVAVYRNEIRVGPNLRLNIGIDLANKTGVAYVLTKGADGNNVVDVRNGAAGEAAQGDITVAGAVVSQRSTADGRVAEACGVITKRPITDGRIGATFCVAKKGLIAIGRVKAAKFPVRPVGVVGRSGIAKPRMRRWPYCGCQ